MILRQYLQTEPVVAASYLFGCGGKAVGVAVDPVDEIEPYLRDSEALGLPLRYVVDTHVHADHISGGRRLAEATGAEEGARALFRSAERLRALHDHLEILPGAFSGSVCGRGLSGKASSTIGFERRFNRAFALTDEEAFVRLMLREIPPRPERAREIRAENLGLSAPASA